MPAAVLPRMRWLRVAVACALAFVLVACMSDEGACGCQMPADAVTYEMYVLTGFDADSQVVIRKFEAEPSDDPGLLVVTALLHFTPPADAAQVNGWAPFEEPIAEVLSVRHEDGEIVVDLDTDMMDPFPLADMSVVPDGARTLEQLLQTVQAAFDSEDPLRVTVRGQPTEGVWGTRVTWPINGSATR